MLDLSRLDNIIQIAKKKYKYLRPEVVWRVLGKPKNIYLDEAGKIVSYLEEKLGRICWDQSEAIEISYAIEQPNQYGGSSDSKTDGSILGSDVERSKREGLGNEIERDRRQNLQSLYTSSVNKNIIQSLRQKGFEYANKILNNKKDKI